MYGVVALCILQGLFFISNRYEIPFVYYGAKPHPVNPVLYKPIQGNKKWVYFYFFEKPHNLVACLFYWILSKAGRALDTWEHLSGSLMNTTFIQKKRRRKNPMLHVPLSIGARIPPELRIAMAASLHDPLRGILWAWWLTIPSVMRFP